MGLGHVGLEAKNSAQHILFLVGVALTIAWIAEYIFGLTPCTLCLYQRYLSIAILVILGIHLFVLEGRGLTMFLLATLGLLMATVAVAFYQVAVEYHWVEVPKICASLAPAGSFEEFQNRVLSNTTPSCDQVQFSLFGLSMAAYNGLFSLGLCVITLRGLLNRD